jgi:N-acetylglucosamine-6-phosphate deacetylase
VLGFFLEGPFLALPGAIGAEALKERTVERIASLKKAVKPYKAIFAASPDVEGIHNLIPFMAESKTPVFMTHTAADVEQTQTAIELGGCHATHFYDVMPCPEERDGGVRPCGFVEAVLADASVSVDFILDGEHVEPVAVKMALECKGPDRVCLVTDANLGAGCPPGRYRGFSNEEVEFAYAGAPARGTENSSIAGGLAGSGLTMDRAVRNAVTLLDLDIPLAVRMASMNPAQVLGLSEKKGQIKTGCDADLVLLDKNLQVLRTWVQGKCCFQNETL